MAIYVIIKPLDSLHNFEQVLMTNVEMEVKMYSTPIQQFTNEMTKWAENSGKGRVFTNIYSVFGIALEDPALIADLKQQIQKWRGTFPLSVGVSPNIFEAYKAMVFAEKHTLDSIVFYDENVEKFFDDEFEKNLFKAENGQSQEHEIDFPNLDLDQEGDDSQKKASGASKKKILDVLTELKEKAPVLAQLRQLDPGALKAINKLVETLGAIAQQGLIKSEDLEKMAIEKVAPGKKIKNPQLERNLLSKDVWDYSHLLDPVKHKDYKLFLGTRPSGIRFNDQELKAELYHNSSKEPAGFALAIYNPNTKRATIDHQFVEAQHRGKELGPVALEAIYTHLYHKQFGGPFKVEGGQHSTGAARAHQKVAQKHPDTLKPPQAKASIKGGEPYDDKFPPYSYTVKSEEELEKDLMPGGEGDDAPDSDFDKKALEFGIKVEMKEHGLDRERATEVAKDHLTEDPHYYDEDMNKIEERTAEESSSSESDEFIERSDSDSETLEKLSQIQHHGRMPGFIDENKKTILVEGRNGKHVHHVGAGMKRGAEDFNTGKSHPVSAYKEGKEE